MGALACMLKEMGFFVTGSDRGVYPPMSTYLTDRDIRINDDGCAVNDCGGIDRHPCPRRGIGWLYDDYRGRR